MTENDIADFKMFDKAPYEYPEPKATVEFLLRGVREEEKTYGPVFTTRFIKHSLDFLSRKIGEKPPEDIKNLDQLAEYLISVADKYPTPYNVVPYAQPKTESELEGQIAAGTHLETMTITKTMVDKPGGEDRNIDLDDVLSKLFKTTTDLKVGPNHWGYKKNEDGSVEVVFPNCPFKDGCKEAYDEGLLKRPGGRIRCSVLKVMCQYLKLVTGYDWDYERLVLYDPHCVSKCYML
nr:hypothetical protein [Candidatus Freyarchaeota archaeon]